MEEIDEMVDSINARWDRLTITNDFVFCKTMQDPELCRDVLEAILGQPIDHVEYVTKQTDLDTSPDAKSIRLDVYVRDDKGTVYDVEMQTTDTKELPQRARYYQSLMALDQIQKGETYSTLKDTLVIFICDFDPFGDDTRVYSFENRCEDNPSRTLGDGAKTIFLSATASRSDGQRTLLNEFLDYVAEGKVTGQLSATLDAAVARVLSNNQWRIEFMKLEVRDQLNYDKGLAKGRELGEIMGLERGLAEGEAAGLKKGLEQGEAEGLKKGLEQGEAEGMRRGLEQGEARLATLLSKLVEAGRMDDFNRALTDEAYRNDLYILAGIE